jgi:Helicase associated domain
MTGIISSASYSMMPTISESELDGLQRHNINMQRSPYPGVSLSMENRLNYHSSIMHLYHQQMNHPSIFTDNLPPLVPTNISSLSTVAQAYGIPNLHHVSMLGTEYQRQIRLQTERYNTATFSHLRGIPFQAEEFHQHMETSQTGPVDDANSINNAYNTNEEEEVDNNTCMSKADGDSGVNYPTEQQLYCNMEQKTDLSLQKNHQESGHLKAKISKKERKKSIPIIKQHKKIDSKWHASYEQLKQYKQKHGNTIVPRGYSLNSKLASWVRQYVIFVLVILILSSQLSLYAFLAFTGSRTAKAIQTSS